MSRTSTIARKTNEVEVTVDLNLDGKGIYQIDTGIPFFDHMLEQLSKHGLFDIKISAKGDTEIDYQITGLGVLYNNLLQSLFSSQIKTLSFVLVSIFLMVSFLFRSLLVGFSVMFIPSISVGVVMSSMSILNIPLDIMTITIASICVGMSVDYAIHFAWRYLKENDEKKTLLSAGRAILITGSTIIMGFLVFLFSNFNPTILFGVFSGIAIFFAMFLSIYLLPRILDLQSK